jgi:VanZ family protein
MQQLYKIIFWAGCISAFLISLLPVGGNLTKTKIGLIRLDYLFHFTAYLLICLYFMFGRKIGYVLFEKRPLLKLSFILCLQAAVTEFVQLWVPNRTFNMIDLFANMTGVAVGLIVVKIDEEISKHKFQDQR